MNLAIVVVAAVLAEAIWESLKMVWQDGKVSIDRIGAIVIGIVITVVAQVKLFALAGLPLQYPIIDMVCSGIVLSRGANFVHDLLSRLQPTSGVPPNSGING